VEFTGSPSEETHDRLWRQCARDLRRLRARMGAGWELMTAYTLERARTASLHATRQSLMQQFGSPAISSSSLEDITVPTALIWGRQNLAIPLAVAEAASERYGWPLHIIEDCADDPPVEQPDAFLKALDRALGGP
jgi:pimeloyl-ACP methyl ester carboxylesterase